MEKLDTFHNLLADLATQAGVLVSQSPKVRNLFLKRAERAAYEYIIEENEDKRPMAVQREKMQIMLNLTETAFKRLGEGLYSKSVIKQGIDIFVKQMIFSPRGERKEIVHNFKSRYGRTPPGFLVIGPTKKCNLHCKGCLCLGAFKNGRDHSFSCIRQDNHRKNGTMGFPLYDMGRRGTNGL